MSIYPLERGTDGLLAPRAYWCLTPEEKAQICNGAGPRNYGALVPDTMYGLSITEAANIHDYMYHVRSGVEERRSADRIFLSNMRRIIDNQTTKAPVIGSVFRALRNHRARVYYVAVYAAQELIYDCVVRNPAP